MNKWEADGRRFEVLMASDIVRDGMALELSDLDSERGSGPALEIFWSDADKTFTFFAHRAINIPLEILSRFVDEAVRSLPPSS
ncbi:hypothetical protein NF556_21005 [Ornithinimicrobium faecis]|uniref:Uncharacterized protein n=1 Tax=Ornithinimicrobium faecis TaxID=2934158 RepID=A0ABY4YTD5_9MICO|nr:hypothetical protein [Ornithinimicrobium sp. HY1793]USQ80032.1 hypothetical protein NF556_21005 [Ornithinimicrobium sp. HY1793]